MNNSNFNPNDEIQEQTAAENEAESAAEVVDTATEAADTAAEAVAEAATDAAEEPAGDTEVSEPEVAPVRRTAVHMTAAAAALNAEGEVDIRRMAPKKEKKIKKSRIPYEKKKGLYGYGFLLIWFLGVIYMFIIPIITSACYSMSEVKMVATVQEAQMYNMDRPGIYANWNNFANFQEILFRDQKYLPALTESLGNLVPQTLMVMVFSLFIALLLNQKFRGRTFARAVFFLPVLVATGPVIAVIRGDIADNGISGAEQFSALFQTDLVDELLEFLGIYNLNQQLTETIQTITSDIFNLIWAAGIQILIFLAALQQIPASAKEAASMEGATGWEFFWKITFPMISPMILANLIYTIIDTFIDSENPVMTLVFDQIHNLEYGKSAAMAWVYFLVVGAALGLIVLIVSRFVFYENE